MAFHTIFLREDNIEEIFLDLSQVPMSQEDLASLEELISRSKTNGPQIGIPWNRKVYEYVFESETFVDPSILVGEDLIIWEPEDDDL